jgi:Uma2 family endonuclease
MGMAAPIYYTAEMVRALPEDGNKYELVHGELLVSPSPRPWHSVVLQRLFVEVYAYVERERLGVTFVERSDISWSPDTLVSPDLIVVPMDEARTLTWARMQHLLLVIEVLSPSTAGHDRFAKRRLFQEQRVPLYWIVDGHERQVELWTPDATFPAFERERLTWHPEGAAEPLTIELARLFRDL